MLPISRFEFIRDALEGTGGFKPGVEFDAAGKPISVPGLSFLTQYPRESNERFARRNHVAWYSSDLRSACERYVGYLSKKPPARTIESPLLKLMADDCDWRGNAIDVFWQEFAVNAKARGTMLLLVDMPRTLPGNQREQVDRRAVPYLVQIAPENVARYKLNERGRIIEIRIRDKIVQSDSRTIDVERVWTDKEWAVYQGGVKLEGEEHKLGVCPVIFFSESGRFMSDGEFSQIADLSRVLFNRRSELDEILRSQTFSLLNYHVPPDMASSFDAAKVSEAIGTHNMLLYHGNPPDYTAPSDGPASTYMSVIEVIEQKIRDVSMVSMPSDVSESGVALTLKFQALNSSLSKFARRMEDLERQVWDLASRWLRAENRVQTSWAKEYGIADPAREMEVLQAMQAAQFPKEAITAKMKQVAALEFSSLQAEEMDTIINAIEQADHERPAAPTGEDGGEGGDE